MADNYQPTESKTWFVVLILIVFWPVGIYFMFKYKKFNKPIRIIITAFFALMTIIIMATSNGGSADTSTNETSATSSSQQEITYPDYAQTDFDKAIYKVVVDNGGEVLNIMDEGDGIRNMAINFKNDEDAVNGLMNSLKAVLDDSEGFNEILVPIRELGSDEKTPPFYSGRITKDNGVEMISCTTNFNSAHNKWVQGQFNLNGSHRELTELIKKNMNDPKSFEHDETKYTDVDCETARDEVNDALKESGYDDRVEIGDLYVVESFRGTNSFGGTVRNTAIAIVHADDSIDIVDIG